MRPGDLGAEVLLKSGTHPPARNPRFVLQEPSSRHVSHQSLVQLGLSPLARGSWVAAGLRQGRPPGPDVLGISSGSFPAGLRLTSGPIHHH